MPGTWPYNGQPAIVRGRQPVVEAAELTLIWPATALVRAPAAVHLLLKEKEKHRSGGAVRPRMDSSKFSLRGCGPGSGGRGEASLGGSVEHQYPIRSPLAIRVRSGKDVST